MVREQLSIHFRERRAYILPLFAATVVGLAVALGSPTEYRASTRLVPYGAGGGPTGLSGLAGLAGVALPTSAGWGTVISVELYPDMARTFEFQREVATSPIPFADRDTLITAADYFASKSRVNPLYWAFQSPRKAPTATPSMPQGSLGEVPPHGVRRVDPALEERVVEVGERMSVQSDRKTGVITVTATMPDPVAAAALVKVAAGHLTRRVTSFEVQKADEQLRFLDRQYRESQSRYDSAQRALANFVDRNRALMSARAQIERSRLERDAELAFELFQQFSREREQTRVKRAKDTPVFAVLEEVAVPNHRQSPHRIRILLLAIAAGMLLGAVRVWWSQLYVETRQSTASRERR